MQQIVRKVHNCTYHPQLKPNKMFSFATSTCSSSPTPPSASGASAWWCTSTTRRCPSGSSTTTPVGCTTSATVSTRLARQCSGYGPFWSLPCPACWTGYPNKPPPPSPLTSSTRSWSVAEWPINARSTRLISWRGLSPDKGQFCFKNLRKNRLFFCWFLAMRKIVPF